MNKKTIYIIVIIILILSLVGNFLLFNKISNMNNKFNAYELSINALNDTIHKIKNKNNIIYYKKTPEISIEQLTNSQYFKELTKEQQKYYNELKKIKGLIVSTQAQLIKQQDILQSLNSSNISSIANDSITFKRGQKLNFNELDTTKNLQWSATVELDSISKFDLHYKYNLNIQTDFIRRKDKSIMVKYTLDDPNVIMTKNNSFIIPKPDETNWQRFIRKNKKWFYPICGGIILSAGIYTGYKIAK